MLVLLGGGAARAEESLNPVLELPADFAPHLFNGLSGGPAQDHSPSGCQGYFPEQPQHRFRFTAPTGAPVALDAFSDGGTLLKLRTPGGAVLCQPRFANVASSAGVFEVFIGSTTPGLLHPYLLSVSQREHFHDEDPALLFQRTLSPTPALELPESELIQVRDMATWQNTFGEVRDLALDFQRQPQPLRVAGVARGTVESEARACGAGFEPVPHHFLRVPEGLPALRLWGRSPGKARLRVLTPQGQWLCDEEVPKGAVIDLEAPSPGTYEVFIGHPEAAEVPYSLALLSRTCNPDFTRVDPTCRTNPRVWIVSSPLKMGVRASAVMTYLNRIQVRHGSPAAIPERVAALRAVVRLRSRSRMVCTGTVVRWSGRMLLLTAAHCLFRIDGRGRFVGRETFIAADGLPALELAAARLPSSFTRCAEQGRSYSDCVTSGIPDLALIPFVRAPGEEVVPWPLCRQAALPRTVTVFGYGLDRGRLPPALLQGTFVIEAAPRRGFWDAASLDGVQAVDSGDSGGPVVTASAGERLAWRAPEVCFIVAAMQRGDPGRPFEWPDRAFFQQVWDLEALLR